MAPTVFGDLPRFELWVRDADVRAVRVMPITHGYPPNRESLGALAGALSEARIPLVIDVARDNGCAVAIP